MAIGQIGANSVTEFFEEITYQVGYNEAKEQIQDFSKDIDNDIIQEAMSSSMNVMVMGMMMLLIRGQENFIQKIFDTAYGLVVIVLASDLAQRAKNKLSGLKGFKFLKKFEMFQKSYADRVATAQLIVSGATSHFHAESNTQNESATYDTVLKEKQVLVDKERLHMELADSMAGRYNDSLLFKLMTKSFTANDELMIKKILGRDVASSVSVDDLNQVADFMYVTDSNGKVTGLSEQFLTMLNGLGYVHNK